MKQTRLIMDMPITVEVVGENISETVLAEIFDYFTQVDNQFSTYKTNSEISKINRGELSLVKSSEKMKYIFDQSEKTKQETEGFFDIYRNGKYDPSGLVKGWAIQNAADILKKQGYKNFYLDAGGDIQVAGKNDDGKPWTVGIRNPFNREQVIKILKVQSEGIATSGTYIRGEHVYNPHQLAPLKSEIVSLTVIGPNIFDADRFATAAFAMGRKGIYFIENLKGFEGYMIDLNGLATYTTRFNRYVN